MLYLTITFKNNTQATYVADALRVTKGFVKVENPHTETEPFREMKSNPCI